MDDEELVRKLKKRGYVIGRGAVRDDGTMLWLINDCIFLFRRDAVDLANGVASLEDVICRNRGTVFPKAPPTGLEKFQDLSGDEKAWKSRRSARRLRTC